MKHDSKHRAALYLNPVLVDNISSSVLMTGNAGHEPVPALKAPVLPYPRVTRLDAPGALGDILGPKYDLAFNFAQVILFDATGGKAYPRSPAGWTERLAYLYNIYGDVRDIARYAAELNICLTNVLPFVQIPSIRTKKMVPCLFEGQTLSPAEMLHPSLSGAEGTGGQWTVNGVVAELAARQGARTDTAPAAARDEPAAAAAPAAAATQVLPAAAAFQWSPQRLLGAVREAVVSGISLAARALNLQVPVAGPDAAATTVLPLARPAPLTSLIPEPDLRVPYATSRDAKAYVIGVVQRFSGQKRLAIPERLKWPERFLLWYGAYTPPGQDHPLPPLWLAAKRYGDVGEIWGGCGI